MRALWLFVFIFLFILILVMALGLGMGFFLHWIFPALDLGAGVVAGMLAQVFSLYLAAKLINSTRAFQHTEERVVEELLKEAKVRRRSRPPST